MSKNGRHGSLMLQLTFSVAALLPSLAIADPINYSFFDARYAAQSSVGISGGTFDSDDSYGLGASVLVLDNVFLWGRYSHASYDLTGFHDENGHYTLTDDDFGLNLGSAGAGYRWRISPDDSTPVDFFTSLSFELNDTNQSAKLDRDHPELWPESHSFNTSKTWSGAGLKLGVRAAVTQALTLSASAYEVSYGSQLLARDGGLDGLSFEFEAQVEVCPHFDLFASYETGELDYKNLDPLTSDREVEVDRDQFWLGARYSL